MLQSSTKTVSLKPSPSLTFKLLVNILTPILIFTGCGDVQDFNVDTGHLSEACQSQVLDKEFLVKFKHEANYRKITASDSKEFLETIVHPMQDKIENYGLNFKFTHTFSDSVKSLSIAKNLNPVQKLALKAQLDPWVKKTTRSEFMTAQGYLGQGVKIAVIDTGLDLESNYFTNNILHSESNPLLPIGFNVAENNYDIQDYNGHGTMVSSLIAAPNVETLGGLEFEGGLAPAAQLIPIKIFAGHSRTTDLSTILKSLDYAIDQKVDIINASWGGSQNCSPLLENKLFYVWSHGILFVTSAGDNSKNLSQTPDFPASFNIPTMVVVSAINRGLEIPSRSNIGGLINIFAPGQDVPVLGLNGQIQLESGTSLASAIATGGAALLKSAFPSVALHTLSYALTEGSTLDNPTARLNIMDLKSSFLHLRSRHILPHQQP